VHLLDPDDPHHVVDGLCSGSGTMFEVEAGPGGRSDEVNRLAPGGEFGYPVATASSDPPARTLPLGDRSPGGCAVQAGRLWVTSLDGTALLAAPYSVTGPAVGALVPVLVKKYGRLRTVVAARDGALWLTTSNRDGSGHPVAADERVIRFVPTSSGGGSPA